MRRLLSLMLLLLAIACWSPGQEPAPAPASRPLNKAEEIAQKIEKQVEKIRGLTFKTPVKIGVYDRETLKAFLLKHSEKELRPERIGPYERALKALGLLPPELDFRKVVLEVLNEQIAGFYDPDTQELRLIDRSAAPAEAESRKAQSGMEKLAREMMARMGIDEDAVIMAHELTHALQDQFAGLKNLPMQVEDDDDLVIASQSVVEGDATMAMMAWTFVKMGQPSKLVFNRTIATSIDQYMDPSSIPGADAVANAPAFMKESLLFPYIGGLKFCIAICAKEKSYGPVDAALKSPPRSTEQILHPEKYTGEAIDDPMAIVLPDLSEPLGAPRLTTNTLGELFTRVLLAEKIPSEAALSAAAGWDGDRYALYGKHVDETLVWLTTWDSQEEAVEFESALGRWLQAMHTGKSPQAADEGTIRYEAAGGALDVIGRRDQDVVLLRGIARDKLGPVLKKVFDETRKTERKKA